MKLIVVLAAALTVLAGCGASADPRAIAVRLQAAVRANDHGSRLERIVCHSQADERFACLGFLTRTKAAIGADMAGVKTASFSGADWRAYGADATRRVAVEVQVNSDGTFVYRMS